MCLLEFTKTDDKMLANEEVANDVVGTTELDDEIGWTIVRFNTDKLTLFDDGSTITELFDVWFFLSTTIEVEGTNIDVEIEGLTIIFEDALTIITELMLEEVFVVMVTLRFGYSFGVVGGI